MADVMLWWQIVVLVIYYTTLPFVWLVEHLLALLALVLAPLLHVLSYALHLALVPIRLLAKLETLYIFFGTAIVLGLLTGLVVYVVTSLINPAFGIKGSSANLHIDHLVELKRQLWPPQRLLRRVLRRLRAIVNEHISIIPGYDNHEDYAEGDDDDDYGSDLHRHDSDQSTTASNGAATLGRTAASFNAERAEKRARLARQQAILGLAPSTETGATLASSKSKNLRTDSSGGGSGGAGKGKLKSVKLGGGGSSGGIGRKKALGDVGSTSSGTTSAAGVADGGEWTATATSRDFGPPTPMMGTMILEEDDSSSE